MYAKNSNQLEGILFREHQTLLMIVLRTTVLASTWVCLIARILRKISCSGIGNWVQIKDFFLVIDTVLGEINIVQLL
jgi:hypothetical protein